MRRVRIVVLALSIPWAFFFWARSSASAQLDVGGAGRGGWGEVVDPQRRLGLAYRQAGLLRLVRALHPEDAEPELGDAPPWVLLDQALIRFAHARRHIPNDPELAYYTATALERYAHPMPDGSTEHRADEAFDAWRRVRELDPTFFPAHVASSLAHLHMMRDEFPEARAEFEMALRAAVPETTSLLDRFFIATGSERALASMFAPVDPAHVHGNLAEAAMLTGDLPSAIDHYRVAYERSQSSLTRVLARWGLAVALDRSGAHEDAVRAAQRAIREDPLSGDPRFQALVNARGALAVLHLDGVFFEPRWEIHAYEALGHEAIARSAGDPVRADELRRALVSWRSFLADGGVASRYAPVARRGIQRLQREIEPAAPRRPR